jgi:UDP-glucose 4-epimerase
VSTHLVTGGAGFIGSHLVESLIARGDDVVVLDNLDGGSRANLPESVEFVLGSVTDRTVVADVFASHRFDSVFHLAAFAAEGISHAVKHHNYTVNLLAAST